jgi:serine phosphatase RsbU (regulator of sigma subunit)
MSMMSPPAHRYEGAQTVLDKPPLAVLDQDANWDDDTVLDHPIFRPTPIPSKGAGTSVAATGHENHTPPRQAASILVVDDQSPNLLALEALLEPLGQRIVAVRSGEDALRKLLEEDFALILLDVQMPRMNGFETANLIRGRPKSRHTPIVFLTAHERADLQEIRGYSLGAVDYLVKPIVPDILRAKVQVFVNLFQINQQVKEQAVLLREHERQEHERQLEQARVQAEAQRHREELLLARQIQQRLFPTEPVRLPGFEIAGASYPATATGGDYFDFIPMRGGGLGIVIGDVCGHGLGPALLMAETRALLWGLAQGDADVGSMLASVNRMLYRDTRGESFVTLFAGYLDPATQAFTYAGGGHPPAYLLGPDGLPLRELRSSGPALGLMPESCFFTVSQPVILEPGQTLVLVTDGVEEVDDPSGELFGRERLLETVAANRTEKPQRIVRSLYEAVRSFAGQAPQRDDVTAVVVKAE